MGRCMPAFLKSRSLLQLLTKIYSIPRPQPNTRCFIERPEDAAAQEQQGKRPPKSREQQASSFSPDLLP